MIKLGTSLAYKLWCFCHYGEMRMRENVIIFVYFYTAVVFLFPCTPAEIAQLDPLSWFMAQKRVFPPHLQLRPFSR